MEAELNGGLHAGSKRRIIVGASDLNFKRDAMEIQPLFQEQGISKLGCLMDVCSKLRLPGGHPKEEFD